MIIDGDSGENTEAAWETHESWRKYEWESQQQYINNHWHVNQYGVYCVDKKATVSRTSEQLTLSTLKNMALLEACLGSYYAKVSTFSTPRNRTDLQEHKSADLCINNFLFGGLPSGPTVKNLPYHWEIASSNVTASKIGLCL